MSHMQVHAPADTLDTTRPRGGELGRRVVVIGEALADLFAIGVDRAPGERAFALNGLPGGAPCNVAVHLAHQGIEASLVSAFADDLIGQELRALLRERGIDLSASLTRPGHRSPLVLVHLDDAGERLFQLYIKGSVLEELNGASVDPDVLIRCAWFHFGSVLLAYRSGCEATQALLHAADRFQVPVSYDVNIRIPVWNEAQTDPETVAHVLQHVDVVKVSDEDWAWMRRLSAFAPAKRGLADPGVLLEKGPVLVVWTRGNAGATLLCRSGSIEVKAPQCEVVDTTGAGDAFMAGVIASFVRLGVVGKAALRESFNKETLRAAGELGRERAAAILAQRGAWPRLGAALQE